MILASNADVVHGLGLWALLILVALFLAWKALDAFLAMVQRHPILSAFGAIATLAAGAAWLAGWRG